MKWPLVGFVLRRVGQSLWQLRWNHLLTATTMALTLSVFGAFMLLQTNLEHLLKNWGEQIQLTAYVAKDVGSSEMQNLLERVKALPEVERVALTSQEQAWREFRAALGEQSGLLDGLPRDVLPASLEIVLKPAERDGPLIEQFAVRLRQDKAIASVEFPQEWVDRLALIVLAVQWLKWACGGLLFLAAFFIVGNTVKLGLLARRDEIAIMQWVGASEALIQAPFVLEGLIQGLAAGALSLGALWGAFAALRGEMPTLAGFLAPLAQPQFFDRRNVALLLALGSILGAAASLFSLRRFTEKWLASH